MSKVNEFIEQQNRLFDEQQQSSMTHGSSATQVSPELIRSGMTDHERMMDSSTPAYMASKFGDAMIQSGAGLVDEFGRAFKGDTMPGPDGKPVFRSPAVDAVAPYKTDFSKVEQLASPMTRGFGSAAGLAGSMAPDVGLGAAAGGVVGLGIKGVAKVAPAGARLKGYIENFGNKTMMAGGGPAMPGVGPGGNMVMRVAGAGAAGAAAGAATNPESPTSGAVQGALFGQAGPAFYLGGRAANLAGDMALPWRQKPLAEEFLSKTLRPGAAEAQQQMAAGAATPPVMPRMPYQTIDNESMASGHQLLAQNDQGYRKQVLDNLKQQGTTLRDQFGKRTAGLEDDIIEREVLTEPYDTYLKSAGAGTTKPRDYDQVFRDFNDEYSRLSIPVDQKSLLKEIVNDAGHGTALLPGGKSAIDPEKFHMNVERAKAVGSWNRLTDEQRSFIDRVDLELRENLVAGKNGVDVDVSGNLPLGMRGSRVRRDIDPGWAVAAPKTSFLLGLGRALTANQREGLLRHAGEGMGDPKTVQRILDDIMAGKADRSYPITEAAATGAGILGSTHDRRRFTR